MITFENITLTEVKNPQIELPQELPELSDELYRERLHKVLQAMSERNFQYLLLYADREHYSNFDYLTGFDPRFEEGLLILSANGKAHCLLGNECFNLHKYSRIPVEGILYQGFSLPNQPIDRLKKLSDIIKDVGIDKGCRVGMVGWKLIYPYYGTKETFDIPSYLVDAVKKIVGEENVENATDMFIHPEYGVRIINTAEDIAYYEYGAAYASQTLMDMIEVIQPGMSEVDASIKMQFGGIPLSCHPMVLSGERCDRGLASPSQKVIERGDRFICSNGLRGGLSCRTGFIAESSEDLPKGAKDYIERIAAPYYATVVNWYEKLGIGVSGGEIFDMVQTTYPKEVYGWKLNPGHLVSTEEWVSSPIFAGSQITVKSGMCFQMDIIPNPPQPYAGANCEDGVAVADEKLRMELAEKYPDVYARIMKRRCHMENVLNITLKPEVLPLSNLAATYRPLFLAKNKALVAKR